MRQASCKFEMCSGYLLGVKPLPTPHICPIKLDMRLRATPREVHTSRHLDSRSTAIYHRGEAQGPAAGGCEEDTHIVHE
eukprot:9364185-Alexandrium_andersonii.AAC.1